jgi:hypothetical protein
VNIGVSLHKQSVIDLILKGLDTFLLLNALMFTKFESINEKNGKILEETKRAFPPLWLNEKQGLSKFQLAKSMSNIKVS